MLIAAWLVKEILVFSQYLKAHHYINKSTTIFPILTSHIQAISSQHTYFKIHIKLMVPIKLVSPKWRSLHWGFQITVCYMSFILFHACPTHFITLIILGEGYNYEIINYLYIYVCVCKLQIKANICILIANNGTLRMAQFNSFQVYSSFLVKLMTLDMSYTSELE